MAEKSVMVVGVDDSDLSYFVLEWTLEHFFKVPEQSPFHLLLVHAQPLASTGVALGPAASAIAILPHIDNDLKMISERVIQKAKEICEAKSVNNVMLEVVDGDARNVLCEAVEKHHASVLVVGCHGHGAIKRAVLGSVSDYCAHHAHCSVMIVKKPKIKH